MIEKLDTKMEYVEISILGNKKAECLDFEAGRKLNLKINELVDAVNAIQKEREAEQFEIQEWIGILEAVRKSVNKLETMAKNTNTVLESLVQENNIHEKQIDELQMKLEPEKCETPAENVQQISYIAPGDMTLFHGAGCSVEFDTPLPKGTRITIKSITKGGDNE